MAEAPLRVALGCLGSPFGVRGWVHVRSYTDPPEEVLDYPLWHLEAPGGGPQTLRLVEGRRHGKGVVARLDGVEDREAAAQLARREFWIERSEMPALPPGQFYRVDLEGLTVVNLQGRVLGRVDHFVDAPANPVMVVVGDAEHWLPLVPGLIRQLDQECGRVIVDWDPDF
jgi:16S rRNA processing protein RimM